MSRDIRASRAYVELLLKDKGFRQRLASAGAALTKFAKAGAMAGAAIAAAAAGGIAVGVRQFIKLGDTLDKVSQRTGLSVEALSELEHAANQSGAQLGDVEKSVRRVQKSLVDAQRGLKSSRDAFADLGLSVDAVSRMSPEKQFNTVVDALANVEDASKRAGLAQNVLGRSGTALLPMVENMRALRQEARDMGIVTSTKTAQSAARVLDLFSILGKQSRSAFVEVGAAVAPLIETALPVIHRYGRGVIDAIRSAGDFVRENTGSVTAYISGAWQSYIEFIAPVLGGYQEVAYAAFGAVSEMVSGAMGTVRSVVDSAWEAVGGSTGGFLEWLQENVLGTLSLVSFGFKEWRTLVELQGNSVALAIVSTGGKIVHTLGTVIPAWLAWFRDHWFDIWTDVVSFTETVAVNIGKNVAGMWDAIVGALQGKGFDFEWTPLTDGFRSAIKELPKIAERELGPLEQALTDRVGELNDDLAKAYEEHAKEFTATIDRYETAANANAQTLAGGPAGASPESAGAAAAAAVARAINLETTVRDGEFGGRNLARRGADRGLQLQERLLAVAERQAADAKRSADALEGAEGGVAVVGATG
ncbi:MAG: hypothetical protein AAF805_09350 [Planctomycetota bacterium]